ncbi:ATP-binding cassette domain-containing protein [Bifidobacterium gallicum]|uniref:ABC transporter, ATP-binding protein n=1 Tax=Bifidobacterium gallicum DSM 20093 = LMG 11596 TaxID=561180 RepID=D1NUR9_9BIFI|nr:ATP-binding cassette domain-containing protein [Bifidobacterium gallicum]EFA22570.1 ABC transporter, ATP-binding protein [Bifidobacterium gallicum DSM 20093 = LMG 11596]KFI59558.1 peptide ABC transporter ATPase [Bifidobacterium gallicum DSM 20093 = LMG 11596]
MADVVLEATGIVRSYGRGRHRSEVLHGVDVRVHEGECVAVVGQSGSGKTTLTRIVFGLDEPDASVAGMDVRYRGRSVLGRAGRDALRQLRAESGIVYQNPFDSLDPRWTVGKSVAEPLRLLHRLDADRVTDAAVDEAVAQALRTVALDPDEFVWRYPVDMSGGQAQRAAIARAIVKHPEVLLADEPMSAIDVAARLQIIDALQAARARNPRMAIVMVSHDLGVVQQLADRIVVMVDGAIVEQGPTDEVIHNPQHAYTRELIAAATL